MPGLQGMEDSKLSLAYAFSKFPWDLLTVILNASQRTEEEILEQIIQIFSF